MQTNDPALTKTRIKDDNAKTNDSVIDSKHDDIDANTTINKGTDTFKEGVVDSKHVNDDDNPARQPDRRDQQGGTAFDGDINEQTVGSEAPQSQDITDHNRYANVDNAQTRILNPDEKD